MHSGTGLLNASPAGRSRLQILPLFLFFLVVSALYVNAQPPLTSLPAKETRPKVGLIRLGGQLAYSNDYSHPYGSAALVFDDQFAYLAGPGGLYRSPLPLTLHSVFNLIGFQNKNIFDLYVNNGSIYVLKESVANQGTSATDHSFLRSYDHGQTFVPMDNGLEECNGGFCDFLAPTQMMFAKRSIIIDAGGPSNLQITTDNGLSWMSLLGSMQTNLCSAQAFEIIGNRVILGGGCSDTPYFQEGFLRRDFLNWLQLPTNIVTPELQNRDVLAIRTKPNSPDVYVAIRGALLKSTDDGETFRYVLNYTISSVKYPTVRRILFPSHAPNVVVVAGSDPNEPFLAYSKDNGETWLDISSQVRSVVTETGTGSPFSKIDFLTEDANGEIFAGVVYGPTKTLKILRLLFNYAMYR